MTISVIDVSGDPYARGNAFGLNRREPIDAFTRDWLSHLSRVGVGDPHAYLRQMLQDTDFLTATRTHAPDLLEEVRGIAAGSGQREDIVLAAQFMDEEWAYRKQATQKCSSIGIVSGPTLTWLAQNMDLGAYTDGHQLALRTAPHGAQPGMLIFTVGSMLALLGVNSRGIGVCVNSLPQLPSAREGLPVAFVIRKVLQARDMADAIHTVRSVPHATGQHYVIAGPGWVRSFEASCESVVEYQPPDPLRVLHTNHPLTQVTSSTPPYYANSIARLRSLTARLMHGTPDLNAIQAALSASDDPDHPVCRLPSKHADADPINFTTGSLIAALQPHAPTLDTWISPGPPTRGYNPIQLPSTQAVEARSRSAEPEC
jgi:isopenicillin-N N-acyltransferase like protein